MEKPQVTDEEREILDERFAICYYDGKCSVQESVKYALEALDVWRKNHNTNRTIQFEEQQTDICKQ